VQASAGIGDVVKLASFRASRGEEAQDFIVWVYAGIEYMEGAWDFGTPGRASPRGPWQCSTSVAESVDTIYVASNLLLAFSKTSFANVELRQSAKRRHASSRVRVKIRPNAQVPHDDLV